MNIHNRIIAGLKTYGFKSTVQVSFISLLDYLFDVKYGTDTVRQVELKDLKINSNNWVRGERYGLTPGIAFNKLMKMLSLPEYSVFVDLGCGKGKILMLAFLNGFKRVVGVEFSNELCECAKNNISIFQKKVGLEINSLKVVNSDVVNYKIEDDENVFYLFNPFDEVILGEVLRNITLSLEKKPREVFIIYYCPFHSNILEKGKYFSGSRKYVIYGCEFVVYFYNKNKITPSIKKSDYHKLI